MRPPLSPARLLARIRTSTAIALVLALLVAGIATGAAGDYLILGVGNDSGSSQTVLSNAGLGAAFTLKNTNVSTGATGIFGWSSQTGANSTRGVYGLANGANSYGVYGRNTGAAGSVAAIFADGNANPGLVIDVDSDSVAPIKVNSTGRVANLNADQLDGLDSLELLAAASPQGKAVVTNVVLDPPDGSTQKLEIIAPQEGKVFHGHINGSLAGPAGTTGTFTCATAGSFGVDLSTDAFGLSFRNANADFVCTELYVTATDTTNGTDVGGTNIVTATIYFETLDVTVLP